MRYLNFLFLVTGTFTNLICTAQEKNQKWSFAIQAGAGLPVGNFKDTNPEQTVQVSQSGGSQYNGFDKKGNGYAKPGYSLSVIGQYKIAKSVFFKLSVSQLINAVDAAPVNTYQDEIWPGLFHTNQTDYHITNFTGGIGYEFSLGGWICQVSQNAGMAIMPFPEYQTTISSQTIKHEGKKPNSNTFALNSGISVAHPVGARYFIGGELGYGFANFNYDLKLITVPGGSSYIYKSDQINYRQLTLGVAFGIKF